MLQIEMAWANLYPGLKDDPFGILIVFVVQDAFISGISSYRVAKI
jgi:hypothetical protein